MKQVLAIFLFISVSYQFAAKMGVIIWFETNRDYVAAELCENRNKPQTGCNGKCYLKKQLENIDQEDGTNKEQPTQKQKNELPEYLAIITPPLTQKVFPGKITYPLPYNNHYRFTTHNSIFHPPPVC